MDLRDSVAIVTGGGTGIGGAICLALADAGARGVVVNYATSAADAQDVADRVTLAGASGVAVAADVSDDAQARALIAEAVERFGALDLLVNNAGATHVLPHADLEGLDDDAWRRLLDVNLMGAFRCSRAAAPQLRGRGGAIVNIASISGHRGVGSSIPYAVSKAAVLQLTRSLAIALAPEVRVNSVTPGAVDTAVFRALFDDATAPAAVARFAEATPLGRIARPEDVAEAVLNLARTGFVTGQDVIVDGGRSLRY